MEKIVYSQASLSQLRQRFRLLIEYGSFLPAIPALPAPAWLKESLKLGQQSMILKTEKQASEWLIGPILLALKQSNSSRIGVFSGVPLNVGDFIGICDFLISSSPLPFFNEAPLMAVVEAKRQELDLGIPQCVAEMLAAQQLATQLGQAELPVFGCVTTGDAWQFLRLQDRNLIIGTRLFYLVEVETILGVFQWVIDQFTDNKLAT